MYIIRVYNKLLAKRQLIQIRIINSNNLHIFTYSILTTIVITIFTNTYTLLHQFPSLTNSHKNIESIYLTITNNILSPSIFLLLILVIVIVVIYWIVLCIKSSEVFFILLKYVYIVLFYYYCIYISIFV